ncbi:MAG: prepilin-type N-terminal cleavage/methylation domain-containing protein [Clostridium sp.]|nr:prepilin-type N-terminal cleavage/methylation domain-containing protein [Clostridium sp.]MCM1400230.1 prepilin-type N-terminal cleavage/methylation domain-containing protein [Clostridium sp.]MCM1460317.1 prepilin-type N-terminal cleavage/methylation domain-containing protein [Bacteroides sp.]
MKKMKKLNDKGYTLVEMIIVIAIIVILSSAAFITLSVLHTAKVRDAATTFYAEVNAMYAKAKGQQAYHDANGNGKMDTAEIDRGACYFLALYKDGDKLFVKRGVWASDGSKTYDDYLDNANSGKGINLSPYTTIDYTSADGGTVVNNISMDDTNPFMVSFNRSGRCIRGAGTYKFKKKNGGTLVTVTINVNGSYQIK